MIQPKEYEYLWTDYDINFIFTSCYLFKELRKTDMILIYDWKTKGLSFFLSKKERIKLSNFGILFYEELFPEWEKKIEKCVETGKRLIRETKRDIPSQLFMRQLKKKFIERVNLFQALGGNYFYTEFFFLDKVEKMKKQSKKMKETLEKMAKRKFEARQVLNEFYNYNHLFMPYVKEIGVRTRGKDLPWLSFEEVAKVIEGKKVKGSRREKTNWLVTKSSNWKLIEGKEAERIKIEFEKHFFKRKRSMLKGVIASKGICRGKVKIIRTIFSDVIQQEIFKVKKGDILIANTTGPEMMMACQKAGAIVTDEGGLTSHAAVVSRELKIPCIIGTKIATQVFKDGDYVEVNANRGRVKILKRA